MNINIAILEDNCSAYTNTKSLIEQWGETSGNLVHITWFQSGSALLKSEISLSFHIVFADIELKNPASDSAFPNGMETCIQLRKQGFSGEIIFLTAFREYVFDGYNVQAFNYFLKPISKEKMFLCLDKYTILHSADFYYFRKDQTIIQIPYNDMITISKEKNNVIIQTRTDIYTERCSLDDFEKRLPANFIRCHKSCIINILHIKALVRNQLKLSNNTVQTVGRSYLPLVRKALLHIAQD